MDHADDIPASINTSSGLPAKEDLERQKLAFELAQLKKPWYMTPQHLFGSVTTLVAVAGMLFALVGLNLKSERAAIDAERAQLNVERAEKARNNAEQERDKAVTSAADASVRYQQAVSGAKNAEARAVSARHQEEGLRRQIERATVVLNKIIEVKKNPTTPSVQEINKLDEQLMSELLPTVESVEEVYNAAEKSKNAEFMTSTTVLGRGPDLNESVAEDNTNKKAGSPSPERPSRLVAFDSDPQGAEVHCHNILLYPNGKPMSPSSHQMIDPAAWPLLGKTPCTVPVSVGYHIIVFRRGNAPYYNRDAKDLKKTWLTVKE